MKPKRKEGYVTGIGCLLMFALFAYFTIVNASNTSAAALMGIFAAFFGALGFGSLWKPETIGAIASEFLKSLSKSSEESSDSHNKQIQQSSSGVQVMATQGSKIDINIPPSEKKENARSIPEEEKEILRKETIVVSPTQGYSYDFELSRGDHLKGQISSTSPVDIYFLDDLNFTLWDADEEFEPEDCSEGVLETNIDYHVPKEGAWYLVIENNERKSATVKVALY